MSMYKAGNLWITSRVPVGSKIKFKKEVQRYTVQASNHFFSIATKPMNAQATVTYTIIDWHEQIRGTENLVFGFGAETKEQCELMLKRLTEGETEISHRNRVTLKEHPIDTVGFPLDK